MKKWESYEDALKRMAEKDKKKKATEKAQGRDTVKYKELNIKEGMPVVADAMRYLQTSIARLKQEKYGVVLIVHGYGSTGKGGAICAKARQWLKAQECGGKVKQVIFGEDFTLFNFSALALKNKCHELAPLLRVCNNGVTVVEL